MGGWSGTRLALRPRGGCAGVIAALTFALLANPAGAAEIGAGAARHAAGHTPARFAAAMQDVYRYASLRGAPLRSAVGR